MVVVAQMINAGDQLLVVIDAKMPDAVFVIKGDIVAVAKELECFVGVFANIDGDFDILADPLLKPDIAHLASIRQKRKHLGEGGFVGLQIKHRQRPQTLDLGVIIQNGFSFCF